ARGRVVDAVVDPAPEDEEVRALEERDVVLVVEEPGLQPVVVEPDVRRVPVLDVLVGALVRGAGQVLGLQVARELDGPELLRGDRSSRSERDSCRTEHAADGQPNAAIRHTPLLLAAHRTHRKAGSVRCSVTDLKTTSTDIPARRPLAGTSRR